MLYGSSPLPAFQARLRPALTLKTRVSLVRDMPAGHGISYGRTFITPRPMRVGTLAVGYADGYPRHLSNAGAEVLIRGRRCPLLGRVTMDQMMVDLSALPDGRRWRGGCANWKAGRRGNPRRRTGAKSGHYRVGDFHGIDPTRRAVLFRGGGVGGGRLWVVCFALWVVGCGLWVSKHAPICLLSQFLDRKESTDQCALSPYLDVLYSQYHHD